MRNETHKITRIVPPVWLMLTMIAMYCASAIVPLMRVMPVAAAPFGQVAVFMGFSLVFFAVRLFKKVQTPLKPFVPAKAVITDGPFRYSRNPVYLGMFIMLAGWAIYLGSLTPWLVAAWFVYAICSYWVPMEEKQMEREMGETYLTYKREVRRWL
jgi:protein-S-isoprenylcysteine O-methyltransferase Ste14